MLPCYLVCVFPKFYLAIIGRRCDKVSSRMKADPIAPSFMPIEHLDALYLHSNERTKIFRLSKLLPENTEVPKSNGRVQRCRDNQIFLMMKLCTHDVVTMSCDNVDAASALIIPNAHGLIIAGREYPWQFVMEEGGSDIVDVSFE